MSDDFREIKKRIYDNEEIAEVLDMLGCTHINKESGGRRIVASLPPEFNRSNKRAVQIYNDESLRSAIRNVGISGDIYSVIGYILFGTTDFESVRSKLYDIKKWVCENLCYDDLLGHKPSPSQIRKQDWNSWLHRIKKKRKRTMEIYENPVIPESVLDNYYMHPVQWWINEGISYDTQVEFGIGFDLESLRIVIPIHNANGQLVGLKGRFVGTNKDILERVKYLYIHPCNKGSLLYNIHRALPYILENREVIILESEKSVMKCWEYGYKNAVAIAGDSLTEQQIKILKDLGLYIRLVFAFDKDKDPKWIKQQVNEQRIVGRGLYSIFDTKRLLSDKDSPVDKGKEVWERMYRECCYRINREE